MSEDSGRDPFEEAAESFLGRLRAGERPALSEYLQRYPHLAQEIREYFPALVMMEQAAPAPAAAEPPRPAAAGNGRLTRLGDYLILREIGRGGMGVVYEAVQESLGRHVALKVLPPSHGDSPMRLERFRREARAAAGLHHSNVVPVFGVGEDQGVHYFAMQFIAGHSLAAVLRDVKALREPGMAPPLDSATVPNRPAQPAAPPHPSRETGVLLEGSTEGGLGAAYFRSVARVRAQAARALEYAHQQGVLHRDVKPANLLLDPRGVVWLSDFGLAKADDSDDLTASGDVVGTLRYLAPERFAGKADARSDVYALALTLFEMATLCPAFAENDRLALIEQIKRGVASRPRQLEPALPRDLETIILKGCDAEPGRRYQSAGEMADDLEAFLTDRPIKARPMPAWQRAARWAKKRPGISLLLLLLLATFVAGLSGVAWQWRRATLGWQDANLGWAKESQEREAKEAALQKERLALDDSQTRLYDRNVALADLYWRENRVRQAKLRLRECPTERRGWEWHHLSRRCSAHLLEMDRPNCCFVRFSPDGRLIALVAREFGALPRCFVEIRDAVDGTLRRTFVLPGHYPCCIWEGGAALLVATEDQKQAYVSDAWTGERLQTLPAQGVVLFSPDGKLLGALDKAYEVLRIWDVASGTLVRTLRLPIRATVLAWEPEGRRLLLRPWGPTSERPRLINARTGAVLTVLATENSGFAAFTPNRAGLVLWGDRLRLCNTASGETQHLFLGYQDPVRQVAFSPDGKLLAAGNADGRLLVWQWITGRQVLQLRGHGAEVEDLAFDRQGRRLVSCDRNGVVLVRDATEGQDVSVREWTAPGWGTVSDDGRRLVSGSEKVPLRVRDAVTLKDLGPSIPLSQFAVLYPSPAVDQVAARYEDGRSVSVWDVQSGRQACVLSAHRRGFTALAFGRGNRLAATYDRPGGVDLWDTSTGRLLRTLPSKEGASIVICFDPGGGRVANVALGGRVLYVWDADDGVARQRPLPEKGTGLAFGPDGRLLAVGFQDGSVALYDAATLDLIRVLGKHETTVDHLAFHGDGRRLASSTQGAVKIWDLERGVDVLELALPERTARTTQLLFVGDALLANVSGLTHQLVRWDGSPSQPR